MTILKRFYLETITLISNGASNKLKLSAFYSLIFFYFNLLLPTNLNILEKQEEQGQILRELQENQEQILRNMQKSHLGKCSRKIRTRCFSEKCLFIFAILISFEKIFPGGI